MDSGAMDSGAMASKDIPRARSRSKSRERPSKYPADNLMLTSLKAPRTVTFDLVPTDTLTSISYHGLEPQPELYTTTVSLHSVNSQDADETGGAHSSKNYASIQESSIRVSHLFHHHEPETLTNRLASCFTRATRGRQFIAAGTLEEILEKRAVERALEYLLAHMHKQSTTAPEKRPFWRRMFGASSTKTSPATTRLEQSTIATHIYHNLRKIFAILLLTGRPDLIFEFLQYDIEDKDLPLHMFPTDPKEGNNTATWLCVKDCRGEAISHATSPRCLKDWSRTLIHKFEVTQWATLTPVFKAEYGHDPIHYRLHEQTILPFTDCEVIPRGRRSDILKVKIHEAHHNFDCGERNSRSAFRESKSKSPFFAIKKISDEDEFRREVSLLKRVLDDHVIPLLATYEQHGEYHLIMPWAKYNLEEFWEREMPNPGLGGANSLQWMARQCLGIASALRQVQHHLTFSQSSLFGNSRSLTVPHTTRATRLPPNIGSSKTIIPQHSFFGRHGDIKPQNLLWFPASSSHDRNDLGIIKICDFGEAEFNKSQSVYRPTNSISYTPSYRPPECDHPDKEVEIKSGTYDTWSLGCLFLEFITWYLDGWNAILEFEKTRYTSDGDVPARTTSRRPSPYFEATGLSPPEPHARIKPAVKEHFKRLRAIVSMQHCVTITQGEKYFLDAFLNLIEGYMLVVNPDGHEPQDGGSHRMTCNHIHEKLGDMGRLIGVVDDVYDDDETSRHRIRHLLRWSSSMAFE